ncbi:hypothetical protein GW944_00600 [Candidatus Parcubacteria bacterium]|nr:hypothetical protein [Candidatus Parcubacteria bacterium]
MAVEDGGSLGKNKDIESGTPTNIMTEDTYKSLKRSREDAEKHLREALKSIGEAGDTSDWHDNFAFDEAHRQVDFWSSVIRMRSSQLKNVIFIQPRVETDRVGLGNAVELEFDNTGGSETFLVLGPIDTVFREDSLSYQTPIGQRILGQPAGKTIEFSNDDQKVKVKIIKILPGNF